MRKIVLSIIALASIFAAGAQNYKMAPKGWDITVEQSGYSMPSTTLAVDLTVETEHFVAGPYARYAQKYLLVRADLTNRVSSRVVCASIGIVDDSHLYAKVCDANSKPQLIDSKSFGSLTIDRESGLALTEEQQAKQAAQMIFSIRKHRRDLINGDVGEGVYGAGLGVAISELDKMESEYLDLFFGKRLLTSNVERFIVSPDSEKKQYILCRFDSEKGIVDLSNLNGAPIYLQVNPSEPAKFKEEVDPAVKAPRRSVAAPFVLAADCECLLFSGADIVARATLPIFEFGREAMIYLPESYVYGK